MIMSHSNAGSFVAGIVQFGHNTPSSVTTEIGFNPDEMGVF